MKLALKGLLMRVKHIILSLFTINSLNSASLEALPKQNISNSPDKFEKATTKVPTKSTHLSSKLTISEATLQAINKIRTKPQTCAPATLILKWNQRLYYFAKEHSIDMAVSGKLSHNGSGKETDLTAIRLKLTRGSTFFERVNQKKDSKNIVSGELIIRSDIHLLKNPKELMNYWIKNPKNCKIMMDPRFTDVALAKVISNKDNKSYWTMLFAGKREKK